MTGTLYGQLASEKHAEENQECRQIAKVISEYGINDRQRLFLIYLMSLEIEDAMKVQEISSFLKEVAGPDTFIAGIAVEQGGNNGT